MGIYLDYQSSKPVDPRVREAMLPYFNERFGNPASLHLEGDQAYRELEAARRAIAAFIGAEAEEIIFTSGATEANNLALIGYALRNKDKGNQIIIPEIEHISIHNSAKFLEKNGFIIKKLPVDQYGRVSLEKLKQRITPQTILITVGYASNEIGTIQEIAGIGKIARERGIAFHSDAVAAEGLIPINVEQDNLDLLTLSSNDIYGPKGLGVLYLRKGVRINPQMLGGGQERGFRSGTENIPAIVGLKKAVEIINREGAEEANRLTAYRDKLIRLIPQLIPHCYLNGHPTRRLPNNVHFRFAGIEGESLVLSLKDEGISAATGSACSSRTLEPSHTLICTGLLHEEAHGSLEFTLGRFNREEDIDKLLAVLPSIVGRLRKLSPLYERSA